MLKYKSCYFFSVIKKLFFSFAVSIKSQAFLAPGKIENQKIITLLECLPAVGRAAPIAIGMVDKLKMKF
ncbi:hypothetical protein DHC50_01900 [Arenibacter sp. A80]|nr:hypothetical protein [Arenibacter sp. A80]RFT57937.1 hypothetical protein D0S24_01900 [Arenibacter sp. P308M17]